jgi:hypothetical protein
MVFYWSIYIIQILNILYYFEYIIDFVVHLLQIKTYFF